MGDFRRVVTALALLALFVGVAAADQPFTCTASTSVPPTVRWEGFTELVGDIVLTCTGGTLAAPYSTTNAVPTANFTVYTNTTITSRLLGTGTATNSGNATEALLMIDDPSAANQNVCQNNVSGFTAGASVCGGIGVVNGIAGMPQPNVYQGVWGVVNPNAVTFYGVPVVPPGTTTAQGYSAGTRIFRITNVRVNANALSNSNIPTPVTAFVSINSSSSVPLNNPNQIVGYVQSGLTTSLNSTSLGSFSSSGSSFTQCADRNTKNNRAANAILGFSENFGNAFKVRSISGPSGVPTNQNVPGQVANNSESGFVPAGTAQSGNLVNGSLIAGFADSGTRLKAVFNNIPNGVSTIYVTATNIVLSANGSPNGVANANSTTPPVAVFIGSSDQVAYYANNATFQPGTVGSDLISGVGGTVPAVALPVVNNTATAVWEVVNSNPQSLETIYFGVAVQFTANVAANLPVPGTGTVSMSFAPTVGPATASSSAPIPRFADTSTSRNLFSISACRTVLLYPFVTNTAGFDTGLAIANTSTDPFGTTPQAGTCQLNAYGTNAPAQAYTTPAVASGTVWTDLASTRLPGFQGYVIAICNFQYAHGFAFISDLGARNLAMGYLALIIPDPGTGSRPASSGTDTGNSEALAY